MNTISFGLIGKYFFFLLLFLALPLSMQAQVTIGSDEPPSLGSLLDLKEKTTTNKGLGMPRIKLKTLTITSGSNLATTIEGTSITENWDKSAHIGLMAYNMNDDRCAIDPIAEGLHVWDGDKWQYLGNQRYNFTDSRDGEVYYAGKFDLAGEWMLENVRFVPTSTDPDFAAYDHNPSTILVAKHYMYPEESGTYNKAMHPSSDWDGPLYKKRNGIMYNRLAALNGENDVVNVAQGETSSGTDPITTPIQGVCPHGWHLPSDKEWNDLEREIYNNPEKYSAYTGVGEFSEPWNPTWQTTIGNRGSSNSKGHALAMLSNCSTPGSGSSTPPIGGTSKNMKVGGFNVFTVGLWSYSTIYDYGVSTGFWTSSADLGSFMGWTRSFYQGNAKVTREPLTYDHFFSVRCKKNVTP